MASIVPYINFADKGREMLEFYKDVFGGKYEMMRVQDSPAAASMDPSWADRIMHAYFESGTIRFMGSDIISDQAGLERGNGYSLVINCDSDKQLREFYAKLVKGGKELWAPAPSEWNSTFAQCIDKYGVQWMFDSAPLTEVK